MADGGDVSGVPSAHRLVVEAWRGDRMESRHEVWCAIVPGMRSPWQTDLARLPAPFIRSAAKPFQLLPLLVSGGADRFDLQPADLAVMAASHNGTDAHAARVEAILGRMGQGPEHLRCGEHRPYYLDDLPPASPEHHRSFGPLHNNCSGNHAALLGLAQVHGIETAAYLEPESPGNQRILALLRAFTGIDPYVAVDDCGAPCYAMPLAATAALYRFLARPESVHELPDERRRQLQPVGDPDRIEQELRRIADAMAHEPQWVSGERTESTRLARLVPGEIVTKNGAEGILCVAHRGLDAALALKVADGAGRALMPALVRLQSAVGWLTPEQSARLADVAAPVRRGRSGQVVGEVRVASPEA
jgi:L-asparaginase II